MRSNSSAEGSLGAGKPALPNITSTGTAPFALAGVTSVMCSLTVIAGYDALSTVPIRSFASTGANAIISWSIALTVQVTLGTVPGTLPYTYSSNMSTSSGRRWSHHIFEVVTLRPSFIVSGSGISGNGLDLASA